MSTAVAQAIESDLSIVIDREMPVKQHPSLVDFYYYADSLGRSEFRRKLALAFPKEVHHDNFDFFVTAAMNRGIKIVLSSTIGDAVDWMTGAE